MNGHINKYLRLATPMLVVTLVLAGMLVGIRSAGNQDHLVYCPLQKMWVPRVTTPQQTPELGFICSADNEKYRFSESLPTKLAVIAASINGTTSVETLYFEFLKYGSLSNSKKDTGNSAPFDLAHRSPDFRILTAGFRPDLEDSSFIEAFQVKLPTSFAVSKIKNDVRSVVPLSSTGRIQSIRPPPSFS
ncbi:MAG: hypothetical protein R2684_02035 [Pyrinomonadaceae bacterium]